MAAYKSGFDPPTRPGEFAPSSRRPVYTQPPSSVRQQHRELDIAHIPGQVEQRPQPQRMASAGLPRPHMREPSPGPDRRVRSESRPRETTGFGFRRAAGEASSGQAQPQLREKGSRNVLRRKPSSIARLSNSSQTKDENSRAPSPAKWTGSGSSSESRRRPSNERSAKAAEAYTEIFTRPPRTRTPAGPKEATIYPELDRYRIRPDQAPASNIMVTTELPHKLATQDLPPPTPFSAGTPLYSGGANSHHRYSGYSTGYSASPSTRFSESPGPGPYSRNTTPTSMSSQSSSIMALKTTTPRLRQGSPAVNRPPLTRRRAGSISNEAEAKVLDPHGLPSLRESVTSSSSNSTVKGEPKSEEKKKRKKRLSPLPPSPPPRKSSQKSSNKTAVDNHESPSKPSLAPARPIMMSPEPESVKSRSGSTASQGGKTMPPSRPSRDGAPDLHSQLGEAMPIIQSNLLGVSFTDRRQSTLPLPRSGLVSPVTQLGARPQGSGLPARQPSPGPSLASPREVTPAPSGLGIIPDLRPQLVTIPPSRATASRTPSPSISQPSSKSRFGLFGRRTKTAPEAPPTEKTLRKGPAAGTGHEGYGRYALRGRSTSAGGLGRSAGRERTFSAASSSEESIASTATHDPFLLERMSPVVIAGGGEIIDNGRRDTSSDIPRTDSSPSLLGRPSTDSKGSMKSGLSHEVSRTTLWPSAMPKDNRRSIQPGGRRRPSDSSEEGMVGSSSLAFRRSIQRLNSLNAVHLPKPLKMSGAAASPSIVSIDTSVISEDSQMEIKNTLGGYKLKKLEKRPKSPRKWNFFHREKSSAKPQSGSAAPVQVSVGKAATKAIPHYALLDSSDENMDPLEAVNFQDILKDAQVVDLSNEELDAIQFGNRQNMEELQNMVVADPVPELQPESIAEAISAQSPEPTIFSSPEPMEARPVEVEPRPTPRPSRLPQVGRIPKVVASRPETTSPKSFSRPFARLSVSHAPIITPEPDANFIAVGPSPPKIKPSTPEPSLPPQSIIETSQSTTIRQLSEDSKSSSDFLKFSPRKDSAATTSSSSGGMSFAGTTAVIPEADAALEEDEVWDEYDDLISNPEACDDDEQEETMKVPVSATSSQGHPFQYESFESRRMRKSRQAAKAQESPTVKQGQTPMLKEPNVDKLRAPLLDRNALRSSSMYSGTMSTAVKDSLATVKTPTTPMSFTDFFSGYGDRNNSIASSAQKPEVKRASDQSTSSGERESREQSPISQVNLRVGSMTVSKWLTFGHVLFSPAREEILASGETGRSSAKQHSVLVIDGLGNDDWSFYAAETYPTSTFYNLSPTAAPPVSSPTTSNLSSPPNHKQISHPSLNTKFPFASSTFHVVVLRFPAAMSETTYSQLIKESKRVLLPGGYLELAILDLDMHSMGNRGRRAVRGLKTRIASTDPSMHVGSASDAMLRHISKKGFTDVKSCKVGIPVASTIEERNNNDNDKKEKKEEISLAEMMRDTSSAGDEGITKMVAKVGRWWYGRCYESDVVLGGEKIKKSIFEGEDGRDLLRECEEWNASFRLTVAYAQKPDVGRRRTASV